MIKEGIKKWHNFIKDPNPLILDELLDENVVFYSPVLHAPQNGKELTKFYLTAAAAILNKGSFTYIKEIEDKNELVLEFNATIDGIIIDGIDMITFNDEGKIIAFKVMLRPLQGLNKVKELMFEAIQNSK